MEAKIKEAMKAAETILNSDHGDLTLNGKDLIDKKGESLYHEYKVVDHIFKELGVHATIFAKDGDDYRRVTTSITDASGKRVVDTVLDRASPAYASIQSGKEYIGEAPILGKTYVTEYWPIFAAGTKNVIGILFVGMEKA